MVNHLVRIPTKDPLRSTMYIDESGDASLNDKRKYYILTGVIAKNSHFDYALSYYMNLKKKYFGNTPFMHATELFSKKFGRYRKGKGKLFMMHKYKRDFCKEFAQLIDTLPFVYTTVCINKDKIRRGSKMINVKAPDKTTLKQAFSIWVKQGNPNSFTTFKKLPISEVINDIKNYKVLSTYNKYPLKIGLESLLKKYFIEYWPLFMKSTRSGMICFEDSSDQKEIIKLMESFKDPSLTIATHLKRKLINTSYPNKYSKFLGLELADFISYGYHLKFNRRLSKTPAYGSIWKVINKRKKEIFKEREFESVIRLP